MDNMDNMENMDNISESSKSSPDAVPASQLESRSQKVSRPDRPCDICRKRKTRCVKEADQDRCVLCIFHNRECTYLEAPLRRKKRRIQFLDDTSATASIPVDADDGGEIEARPRKKAKATQTPTDPSFLDSSPTSKIPALLDCTLGLHPTTHFQYIGPSSVHEARLLDLIHRFYDLEDVGDDCKFRRVADSTTFLSRSDRQTHFSSDVDHDLDTIERIVHPHGPGLVDLYFRIVHPSYPILHKRVFLEKYSRSYKEFSPSLLAAVYLLAMDWWEYDRELASKTKPNVEALARTAMKALSGVVHRPKLSSVQAALLLLQRSGGDSWILTSQVVAVGEELGLHVDCTSWNIPEWEKGLRRRLAWAIFMQDKWSALIYGRPSHIGSADWQMPRVSLADFPESAADEDDKEGSTGVETGRLLFIHLIKLTQVMAQALDLLYSADQTRIRQVVAENGVQGLLELVKPLAVSLKEWAGDMPAQLRMEDVKTRKLCSNGYLHLSYFVTEIIIHRHIIRSITPDTPKAMRDMCRDAARVRLERVIDFVEALRPEHLQAFWWFASPRSLAFIRTYGGLLWATSSTDEEAEFYRNKLADFRWSLKVRAKGVSFVSASLQEMDESLQDIDMTHSPIRSRTELVKQRLPQVSSTISPGITVADAQTQTTSNPSSEFQQHLLFQPDDGTLTYPGRDQLPESSDFSMLDLGAGLLTHDYFSDVAGGDQGFLYSGIMQP